MVPRRTLRVVKSDVISKDSARVYLHLGLSEALKVAEATWEPLSRFKPVFVRFKPKAYDTSSREWSPADVSAREG